MSDFSERLAEALAFRKTSRPAFAAAVGVTQSAVGHWLAGRREPPLNDLREVARVLQVRAAWLAFGEGSMVETERVDTVPPPPARGPRRASGVTRAATTAPAVKVA